MGQAGFIPIPSFDLILGGRTIRAEIAQGAPDAPSLTTFFPVGMPAHCSHPLSLSFVAPVDGFPAKLQKLHDSSFCISLPLSGGLQDLPCV